VQVKNPETGEVLELRSGQWVPVAKVPVQEKRERLSTGAVDAALVGAGDTLNTWGMNARDLWAGLRGNEDEQMRIVDERAEAQGIRNRLHEEAPVAAAVGSMLPALATMPLGMGVGAGLAQRAGSLGAELAIPGARAAAGALEAPILAGARGRLGVNAGMSAAQGALGSQTGELGADALEGLGWAGGGMLASNMVSRVRAGRAAMAETRAAQEAERAAGVGLDEAQQGVIDGARRAGLRVTPGQALNDPSMRQLEASAASNPVLSPYWQQLKQENAQQINRLAAKAMGVEADNVGPAVRATAEHQIGQQFEDIGRQIGRVETGPLKKRLAELAEEESTALLPRVEIDSILARFERGATSRSGAVAGEAGDLVTGPALMRERSRISSQMRDAYQRGDSTLGKLYGDVVDAMDEAVRSSARKTLGSAAEGRAVAELYDETRSQWSVLRAMERGGATVDGQVLPGQSARILGRSDKTGFWGRADDAGQTLQRRGTGKAGEDAVGDLYDGLRFASSQLGKDIVGDSGTATRLATSGMFEGGLLPTIGRAGAHVARRALVGPLARRYMEASPEAAQAWQAAVRQSGLAGWTAGNQAGAAAGRAGSAILSAEEAGPYLPPTEGMP
jgi:hypothetical protein